MRTDEQTTATARANTGILRCAQDDENDGRQPGDANGDQGYVLLAVLVLVFLMLLALSIAAPRVAMQLKHDQELETQNRAKQYVRAIRMFHKKTGTYPTSIEQLEKTNNQRYLRQRYLDPLTGKDDWRLIQVGQNKTTVKGFFGKELPGPAPGLGAAAGLQSNVGGSNSGSAFGGGSTFGSNTPGSNNPGSNTPGSPGSPTGATGSGTGSGGVQSTDATAFTGSKGPIMGVGVPKEGDAFLTVNGVSTYQEWEFLYDPRVEQLAAQGGGALGGGGGGSLSPTPPPAFGTPGQTPPQNPPAQPTPTPTPTPQ